MRNIASTQDFDAFLGSTTGRALFLLKHSTACGLSARALDEYRSFLAGSGEPGHAYLDLRAYRDVSVEVSQRSGIAHQSPQAILFVDGKAVWSASHWSLTHLTLSRAIADHAPKSDAPPPNNRMSA